MTQAAADSVLVARDGPIATVTLNNPARRNALTKGAWRRLAEVMEELDAEDDLRCVVSLDSAAYEVSEDDVRSKGLFESAFGTDPVVLADASPTVQAVEHAGDMPEFIIVTRGTETRTAEAEAFAEALEAAGSSAELIHAGGYSHEEVNTAVGDGGEDVVTPPVRRFLESCLR